MTKILSFAGSNSSKSINHQMLKYIQVEMGNMDVPVDLLKLSDFDIPIYGIDVEDELGIPEPILDLFERIQKSNALIISVAEHNGNLTAFFKSIIDWLSRTDRNFIKDKSILLLSTSPGGRGGVSALESAKNMFTRFKGNVVGNISIGDFNNIFKDGNVIDNGIEQDLKSILHSFINDIEI